METTAWDASNGSAWGSDESTSWDAINNNGSTWNNGDEATIRKIIPSWPRWNAQRC